MALVKFGAGVSEMRGKEGGVVYSRNAYGAYIKQKVSPVNPQTNKQLTQRGLMGNLAQLWSSLTSGEAAAWDNLGAQVTRINRFGDSTIYTGFSLFMRLNRNLSVVGEDPLTVAPAVPTMAVLTPGAFIANVTGTVLTLAWTADSADARYALVFYITNNILTGRKFVKNFYRKVAQSTLSNASPTALYTGWNTYYGNPLIEDATIFYKVKLIDKNTGFDSTPLVGSTVVINS